MDAMQRDQRAKVLADLRQLEAGVPNLDLKALTGHPGWMRLRSGDWRVLYRSTGDGLHVARVVNRRDLERAVRTLP